MDGQECKLGLILFKIVSVRPGEVAGNKKVRKKGSTAEEDRTGVDAALPDRQVCQVARHVLIRPGVLVL